METKIIRKFYMGPKAKPNVEKKQALFLSIKTMPFFISCMLVLSAVQAQKVAYVASTGSGTTGATWATAYKTITAALAAGGTGQLSLYIKAGTYNGNYVIPTGRNVYIKGGYPTTAIGIDTSGYNPQTNITSITPSSSSSPAFEFSSSYSSAQLSIIGITFTSGSSTFYPIVFGNSSSFSNDVLLFKDLTVVSNNTGGTSSNGLFTFSSLSGTTVDFENTVFGTSSTTGNKGTAIYWDNNNTTSTLIFNNSSVNYGTTQSGDYTPSIYLHSSNATSNTFQITNSSFCNNTNSTSNFEGAGVYLSGTGSASPSLTISNCTFSNNTSNSLEGGAAINVFQGDVTCSNSIFYDNSASNTSGKGGAVYINGNSTSGTTTTFSGCTFYGNTCAATGSLAGGGAMYIFDDNFSISSSYFYNNTVASGGVGGAICLNASGNCTALTGTYFAGNKAGSSTTTLGSDIYCNSTTGNFKAISTSYLQLAASTSYTPTAQYTFGSGNTFGYATVGSAPSVSCKTAISTYVSISGTVWDDANGDAINNNSESYTNGGGLYANLVSGSTVLQSSAVNSSTGAYSFTNVAGNSSYSIILTTSATSATPALNSGWQNTGVNLSGTANTANRTGVIPITLTTASVTAQNFGIVQCPNGLTITPSSSKAVVCKSSPSSVILTSTPSGGITAYTSYAWSGSGIGTTNTQNTTATPTATTVYSVTVTDAVGCTATGSVTVTYDLATPSISLSCGKNANNINYAQLSENSGTATSWLWTTTNGSRFYPDNTLSASSDATTSTSQVTYVDYNGVYNLAITDANGCSGSGQITINSGSCTNVLATSNLNFTAEKQNNEVVLNWSTTSETNNSYFNIERSSDGNTWQFIGTVNGQGNSSTVTNYSFTDALPLAGTNYYRLKVVDENGQYSYSPVRQLQFTGQWLVKLYPNPVQNYLVLEFNNDKDEKANIIIQTVVGNTVFAAQQQLATGLNHITLNNVQQLTPGTYMLVMGTMENTFRSKFVKGY